MNTVTNFLNDESGASAAEYALILAVIAVALFAAMGVLSSAITGAINNTATLIKSQ